VLGVERTVFELLEYDQEQDLLVARVRPTRRARGRCGLCRRPCPGYDGGDGRWRALDLGTVKAVLEAEASRVSCRRHEVVVAAAGWARHGAGHAYAFDDTVVCCRCAASKSAVRELMRVAWRTVKRGNRYLTAVVDDDSRWLIWAASGRDKAWTRPLWACSSTSWGRIVEPTNTKIRVLTRVAFDFPQTRSPHRPGHARPRGLLPTTTRPSDHEMTHRSSRGATLTRDTRHGPLHPRASSIRGGLR
jgi:hypothetical protein